MEDNRVHITSNKTSFNRSRRTEAGGCDVMWTPADMSGFQERRVAVQRYRYALGVLGNILGTYVDRCRGVQPSAACADYRSRALRLHRGTGDRGDRRSRHVNCANPPVLRSASRQLQLQLHGRLPVCSPSALAHRHLLAVNTSRGTYRPRRKKRCNDVIGAFHCLPPRAREGGGVAGEMCGVGRWAVDGWMDGCRASFRDTRRGAVGACVVCVGCRQGRGVWVGD